MNKSTWITMGAVALVAAVTPTVTKYVRTWWKKGKDKNVIDITEQNSIELSPQKEDNNPPQKQSKPVFHTFS